jgi:phage-related minor tail protein
MQLVTTAALQMQNATGQAVSETIKQFTDLAGDPAAAVAKLNEQQHFLTLSVYD